jgi:hypothetical protein
LSAGYGARVPVSGGCPIWSELALDQPMAILIPLGSMRRDIGVHPACSASAGVPLASAGAGIPGGRVVAPRRRSLAQQRIPRWNDRFVRAPAELKVWTNTPLASPARPTTVMSPGAEAPRLAVRPIVPR